MSWLRRWWDRFWEWAGSALAEGRQDAADGAHLADRARGEDRPDERR